MVKAEKAPRVTLARRAWWSVALSCIAMGCTTNDPASRLGLPAATPMPAWAHELAGPLPTTTARMLRLDRTQREHNPLGVEFAARLRLEAATALHCAPVVTAATHDLRRATGSAAGEPVAPAAEAAAIAFARRLSLEGHAITDAEFATLLGHFGPERTTAIVHTVAWTNFLCRIVHGLGSADALPVVHGLPEADVAVDATRVPERRPWADVEAAAVAVPSMPVDWRTADHAQVCTLQRRQTERALRMPLPEDARLEGLAGRAAQMAKKVAWSRVGYGYQRAQTAQWFACLYAFYEESRIDPVFENSTFWVVTRTNDCFY